MSDVIHSYVECLQETWPKDRLVNDGFGYKPDAAAMAQRQHEIEIYQRDYGKSECG